MSNFKKFLILFIIFSFLFLLITPARAQQKLFDWLKQQLGGREAGVFVEQPAENVLVNVVMWVMSIIGVICVIFIIYGAIVYTTSGGSEEHVKRAKQILLYAIIGLVTAIMALVIATLVTRVIGPDAWAVVCDYDEDGTPESCINMQSNRSTCETTAGAQAHCSCIKGNCASFGL